MQPINRTNNVKSTMLLLSALMGGMTSQTVLADTPFPGGLPITKADLTQTPAQLPVAPPAYNTQKPISHEEFARFAWRQFIYLNSPAKKSNSAGTAVSPVMRGVVSSSENFVTSGKPNFYHSGKTSTTNLSKNVTVWESFAHRSELFPNMSTPQGNFQTMVPQYRFKNATVSTNQSRFNNLDENSQIGQNKIFFPANGNMPSTNPSDDHEILFEAKVNQAEYDYIKSLNGTTPSDFNLPPNSASGFTDQETIEIKAAWRELSQEMIESGRYHTAEALYYREAGSGDEVSASVGTFGLVGLHIIRKMPNYEAFVFSTFEHVDNLKKPDGTDSGLYFITTYDQLDYLGSVSGTPNAIINNGVSHIVQQLPLQGEVKASNGYQIIPGEYNLPTPSSRGPIKVVQPPTITKAVYDVNSEVKAAMQSSGQFRDSVWQYYELKGVQPLPVNEDQSAFGANEPLTQDYFLANNVIESSQPGVQLFKGGAPGPTKASSTTCPNVPAGTQCLPNPRDSKNIQNVPGLPSSYNEVVMGGCMGCHGQAKYQVGNNPSRSIFSFLISTKNLKGKGGFDADALDESGSSVTLKAKKYMAVK